MYFLHREVSVSIAFGVKGTGASDTRMELSQLLAYSGTLYGLKCKFEAYVQRHPGVGHGENLVGFDESDVGLLQHTHNSYEEARELVQYSVFYIITKEP